LFLCFILSFMFGTDKCSSGFLTKERFIELVLEFGADSTLQETILTKVTVPIGLGVSTKPVEPPHIVTEELYPDFFRFKNKEEFKKIHFLDYDLFRAHGKYPCFTDPVHTSSHNPEKVKFLHTVTADKINFESSYVIFISHTWVKRGSSCGGGGGGGGGSNNNSGSHQFSHHLAGSAAAAVAGLNKFGITPTSSQDSHDEVDVGIVPPSVAYKGTSFSDPHEKSASIAAQSHMMVVDKFVHSHPDNEHNDQYRICISGLSKLKAQHLENFEKIYIWMDYCCLDLTPAHIDQTLNELDLQSIMACCDSVFTPLYDTDVEWEFPSEIQHFHEEYNPPSWSKDGSSYMNRAWCRMELLFANNVPLMRDLDVTDLNLYVTASPVHADSRRKSDGTTGPAGAGAGAVGGSRNSDENKESGSSSGGGKGGGGATTIRPGLGSQQAGLKAGKPTQTSASTPTSTSIHSHHSSTGANTTAATGPGGGAGATAAVPDSKVVLDFSNIQTLLSGFAREHSRSNSPSHSHSPVRGHASRSHSPSPMPSARQTPVGAAAAAAAVVVAADGMRSPTHAAAAAGGATVVGAAVSGSVATAAVGAAGSTAAASAATASDNHINSISNSITSVPVSPMGGSASIRSNATDSEDTDTGGKSHCHHHDHGHSHHHRHHHHHHHSNSNSHSHSHSGRVASSTEPSLLLGGASVSRSGSPTARLFPWSASQASGDSADELPAQQQSIAGVPINKWAAVNRVYSRRARMSRRLRVRASRYKPIFCVCVCY
jgi:hypothetical protein